ncbi:MAG: helix-turn-helix transcriptional regulator [Luteimonas sp.]|nr:helix-turn-helix transcriptional regulator [Luteimonas sp.]
MDAHHVWADRGQSLELNDEDGLADARWVAVSRLANLRLAAPLFSVWLQIRGGASVDAKEGSFRLVAGDWIAFERESQPELQTDRMGLTLGLVLSADVLRSVAQLRGHGLFAGRGRIPKGERAITLRLWREAMRNQSRNRHAATASQARLMQPLLMQLSLLQGELASRLGRCPGRSRNRKGQVFSRLQRAHLFLEGHRNRVVSLTELAELTSFSSWYFSKTFHSIYDESPQAASQRMRLEHACELLANTSLVIGEVGAACGFDNACSFARAFRTYTGTTASAYREQSRRAAPNTANASNVARKAVGFAYT